MEVSKQVRMKVAFDISRMNKLSRNRGIGIHSKNLFESLKKYTDLDIDLIEEKTDYRNYDLIHFPFLDLFTRTLPLKIPKPFVVTVHDLIPIQFSKHYPAGLRGKLSWHLQKLALKKASRIITISNSVKKDIVEILNFDEDKVKVIYLAPSENFKVVHDKTVLQKTKQKYNLPDEFVLYVGNINWNKNILNMTEAVMQAGKKLVIIGGAFLDKNNLDHPERKSFKDWLNKYEANENILRLGFIPEEEIVRIMNLAKTLIFVSHYEGFGLPILEAQACGLPVITSNNSATAEVAGRGALLVDPENVNNISSAIEKIFNDIKLRDSQVKSGKDNLDRFSWEKIAKSTLKVYEDTLS